MKFNSALLLKLEVSYERVSVMSIFNLMLVCFIKFFIFYETMDCNLDKDLIQKFLKCFELIKQFKTFLLNKLWTFK